MQTRQLESELYVGSAVDVLWNLFCATGAIGYYMFYRQLITEPDGTEDNPDRTAAELATQAAEV
ncbi:MAG: hypothetical protein GX030_05930 [Firmicutes bacterium]|nr:hypothetical protein [Bacillota bacterium]